MMLAVFLSVPHSFWMVAGHLTFRPPHPKFYLQCSTKMLMFVHLVAGAVELLCGTLMWFVPNPVPFTTWQAVSSLFHSVTALGLLRVVFGGKVIVVPLLFTIAAMKFYLAANLLAHPDCYLRALSLSTIHTSYSWHRLIYGLLEYFALFPNSHFTMSVVLSALVVAPLLGPAWVPFIVGSIFFYGVYMSACKTPEQRALATQEDSRDVFTALGCAPDILDGVEEDDSLPPRQQSDCIFDVLDSNKRGVILVDEMTMMLLRFGLPESDVRSIESKLHGVILDKEHFFMNFRPLWVFAYHHIRQHKKVQAKITKRAALVEHAARELEAME